MKEDLIQIIYKNVFLDQVSILCKRNKLYITLIKTYQNQNNF